MMRCGEIIYFFRNVRLSDESFGKHMLSIMQYDSDRMVVSSALVLMYMAMHYNLHKYGGGASVRLILEYCRATET